MNNILSSVNSYNWSNDGPYYIITPCKRLQQSLHHWIHNANFDKWYYAEDPGDEVFWMHFYKVFHRKPLTSTSEKIVDMFRLGTGGGASQLWAFKHNEI